MPAVDILATATPKGAVTLSSGFSEEAKMVGKWLAAGVVVGFIAKSVVGSTLIGATAGVGTIAALAYLAKGSAA